MRSWLQLEGSVHALPAIRGGEKGAYLWITAGEHFEALAAELFLPAIDAAALDGAMAVGTGMVDQAGEHRSGEVHIEFGRVTDDRGVLTATGELLDADIRFALRRRPPGGGFCRHCGSELDVPAVRVITPPDGGLMGSPAVSCSTCGAS